MAEHAIHPSQPPSSLHPLATLNKEPGDNSANVLIDQSTPPSSSHGAHATWCSLRPPRRKSIPKIIAEAFVGARRTSKRALRAGSRRLHLAIGLLGGAAPVGDGCYAVAHGYSSVVVGWAATACVVPRHGCLRAASNLCCAAAAAARASRGRSCGVLACAPCTQKFDLFDRIRKPASPICGVVNRLSWLIRPYSSRIIVRKGKHDDQEVDWQPATCTYLVSRADTSPLLSSE